MRNRGKPRLRGEGEDQSLRPAVSCSLSAASLAKGELGSIGRSRSRGGALEAYCRCDGPPPERPSRSPRSPLGLPANLPLSLSRSLPLSLSLPPKRSRGG